jgi:hypothetical protein
MLLSPVPQLRNSASLILQLWISFLLTLVSSVGTACGTVTSLILQLKNSLLLTLVSSDEERPTTIPSSSVEEQRRP